jgi:hypothetical protein
VKFYFVYKSLAHPELAGRYVQPFTLSERLAHARQAEKQLGTTIPWLVDTLDNELKHALGDRPNSEFIIDPNGIIVRKRAWSFPAQVRKDLEQLVGPAERVTREEDVHLKVDLPKRVTAGHGVLPRINRSQMHPMVLEPQIDPQGLPFYAKLRAEADDALLKDGAGKLYLGFHLDPLHDAHWNNLTAPLFYSLSPPDGVEFKNPSGKAPNVEAASDTDPREFLVDVAAWPTGKPVRLTVTYFACVGETNCYAVRQSYVLHRKRDVDGGRARGAGAGYWDRVEFTRQMLARDKDGDGKLNADEVSGLVRPHFDSLDTSKDGLLDSGELEAIADWLNHHHQPGAPPPRSSGVQRRPG